jgi:hypothetical protein
VPFLSSPSPSSADAARDELRALLARYPQLSGGEARVRPTVWETAKFLAFYLLPGALITWAVAEVA